MRLPGRVQTRLVVALCYYSSYANELYSQTRSCLSAYHDASHGLQHKFSDTSACGGCC